MSGGTETGMQRVSRERLCYTFSSQASPAIRVERGEVFILETEINVGSAITPESSSLDLSRLIWPYVNPLTGPIYVEGADIGDVLRINFLKIEIQPPVYCALVPGWSPYKAWFNRQDFALRTRVLNCEDGYIRWNEHLRFPAKPMLGTVGVAPMLEAPSSVDNGIYGGNMDVQEATVGSTLVLPCLAKGGYLYMGDAQAHQGDGELACTSIECRARVTLRIDVLPKPASMSWPRIETPDFILTAVSTHPIEHALLTAFEELVNWIVDEYDTERDEVFMLAGHTVEARATAICNPNPTYVCKLNKTYLHAFKKRP